jgi:SAM-dependent methyltransferase
MALFLPYNQDREENYLGENTLPIAYFTQFFPLKIPGFFINRIIDIGTGKGDFVRSAVKAGFDAYGVDLRDLFVGDRGRFRRADITDRIPFPDGHFDLAFDHLFLDDLLGLQKLPIDKVRKAITEIHRVLKDGGYFFMYPPLFQRDEEILQPEFTRVLDVEVAVLYQKS